MDVRWINIVRADGSGKDCYFVVEAEPGREKIYMRPYRSPEGVKVVEIPQDAESTYHTAMYHFSRNKFADLPNGQIFTDREAYEKWEADKQEGIRKRREEREKSELPKSEGWFAGFVESGYDLWDD